MLRAFYCTVCGAHRSGLVTKTEGSLVTLPSHMVCHAACWKHSSLARAEKADTQGLPALTCVRT